MPLVQSEANCLGLAAAKLIRCLQFIPGKSCCINLGEGQKGKDSGRAG